MTTLVSIIAALCAGVVMQPPPAMVTVLRIAAGPHGDVRNGDFVLTEERTEFDPASDKEVFVLFQWQGQPGVHRLIAHWSSPDGAAISTSPIDYTAKDRRFGAYWSFNLSATSAPGMWSVEATVDGQPAGRFTFNVRFGATPPAGKTSRRSLTQAELFARGSTGFVLLERSTVKGQRLEPAAAFAAGHGRLFTAVAALDGADVVTAVTPDGKRQPVTHVVAMNRRQDWMVVDGGPDGDIDQPLAPEGGTDVGTRCYAMESSSAGSRVLIDAVVSGRAGSALTGPRFVLTLNGGSTPPGEPVFNEFGELVGLLGGSLVPGASEMFDLLRFRAELHGVPMIPISAFRFSPEAQPATVADVRARGDLLGAVQGAQNVLSGGFARTILRTQTITPGDQRQEFSAADKEFVVFITWSPQTRLKGLVALKAFDENNVLVADSKPGKIDIRPGDSRLSSWKLPVPDRPGIYRADVLIDNAPIWRGFVRIGP
jgi:hypothetical protein